MVGGCVSRQVRARRRGTWRLRLPLPCRATLPAWHPPGADRRRRQRPGPLARSVKREVVQAIVRAARLRHCPREATALHVAALAIGERSWDAMLRLGPLPSKGASRAGLGLTGRTDTHGDVACRPDVSHGGLGRYI